MIRASGDGTNNSEAGSVEKIQSTGRPRRTDDDMDRVRQAFI